MRNIFFLLLTLLYSCSYTTEIPLSPLIIGHIKLYYSITENIIQKTIAAKPTIGQHIALFLVCKSWQVFCQNDQYILSYLSKNKECNQDLLTKIYNRFTGDNFKTEHMEEIVTYHWFDVRYQSPQPNSYSVLQYAIQKKYYLLFEKLLTHPYVIIRPIILETIIKNANTTFFDILKKHAFNFGRYHFACQYSTYLPYGKEVSYPIPIVTYSEKKKSTKKGEKSFLWLMGIKIADNALVDQRNQDNVNRTYPKS